ncbi:MAG: hypothetical protein LAQ69_37015 [Acidobacteriia bacterium]|nr:hypothetical protein [Terriglobia bacterium]
MKKTYAFVVSVPKTEEDAYDHDRPISSLIEFQLKHLQEAEKSLPKRSQTNIDINTLKTERQASEYIQKVTAKLHPQGARKPRKKSASKPRKGIKAKATAKKRPAKRKSK